MQYLKYTLLFLILGLITLIGCSYTSNIKDWTKEKLKGEVKSFSEAIYEAKVNFDNVTKGEQVSKTSIYKNSEGYELFENCKKVFNKQGQLIEKHSFHIEEDYVEKELYIYDKNGKFFEIINKDDKNENFTKIFYERDNNGNIIQEESYYIPYTYTDRYDDDGKLIEFITLDSDSTISKKYIYRYNEHKKLIEERSYKSDGSIGSRTEYKYYEDKNLLKQKDSYGSWGILLNRDVYIYNNKGNIVERGSFKDMYIATLTVSSYDDNGNLIEEVKQSTQPGQDWKEIFTSTYKYDKDNNLISNETYFEDYNYSRYMYEYNSNNLLIDYTFDTSYERRANLSASITYEYDERGNWITAIVYTGITPKYIIERKYDYY